MHATQQNLDFLIPEDTNNLHEELYSVEQDKLLPITSPFLMPGIYKKIGVDGVGATKGVGGTSCSGSNGNVFISAHQHNGRIVPFGEFQHFYATAKQPQAHTKSPSKHVAQKSRLHDINDVDSLTKMANDMMSNVNGDSIVIDRKRNAVVRTPFGSQQKTIYRLYTPEKLGLKADRDSTTSTSSEQLVKLKTRRRKCPTVGGIKQEDAEKLGAINESTVKTDEQDEENTQLTCIPQQSSMRTRSGRVVKPLKTDFIGIEQSLNVLTDLQDRDYTCSIVDADTAKQKKCIDKEEQQTTDTADSSPPAKRRVPPEAICPTCNKIFLGRRIQRHFAQNPHHMLPTVGVNSAQLPPPPPPPYVSSTSNAHETAVPTEETTLFRFLTTKLQKSHLNEDQRAELFLNEINDLVEQLQLCSSRLIRSTSGLHMVTAPTARVLGIPEGQYALDMSAIQAPPPEPETSASLINFSNTLPAPNVNTRSLDYTSVSIDDTLTDEAVQKLNLSAGGKLLPPSEESLLRAVDDFVVRDGMEKLGETNLLHPPVANATQAKPTVVVPHIDHASDNAVEAVTMKETPTTQQQSPLLDLAVDFFQFNNN